MKDPNTFGHWLCRPLLTVALVLTRCSLALNPSSPDQCDSVADCPEVAGTTLECRQGLCVQAMNASEDVGVNDTGTMNDAGMDPEDAGEGDSGEPPRETLPFVVDSKYVPSGFMGDGEDGFVQNNDTAVCEPRLSEGRGNCYHFTYRAPATASKGFGGVYWQYPANNWENEGYPMPFGAELVSFWAWADVNDLTVTFNAGINAADRFEVSEDLKVSRQPRPYVVDITGNSYDRVAGAFAWSTDTPTTAAYNIYIDDIVWTTKERLLEVVFSVDIETPLTPDCFVGVYGSFNQWRLDQFRMYSESEESSVYTTTIPLPTNRGFDYLFYTKCGEVEMSEQLMADVCTRTSTRAVVRRVDALTQDEQIRPTVCFESCAPCP